MKDINVIIVGAGIGGLAAALALQRAGVGVSVYEQVTELGEIGAGISLGPNATRVLHHLGLEMPLATIGLTPRVRGARHYKTGERLRVTPMLTTMMERWGAPYYQVHRADLHGIIADAVLANDPNCVHLGENFQSYTLGKSLVTARFTSGLVVSGDALVGADGIRSTLRECLFGPEDPFFTGNVAWRGLVPTDKLPDDFVKQRSAVWLGPDHHFVCYTVRNDKLLNYVAVAEKSGWAEEGWMIPSRVSEVLAEFSHWDPQIQFIIKQTVPGQCFKWALFDRDPLCQWTKGRVALLGDAAHPMLPFMGQGAGMAIEDSIILARCMKAYDEVTVALKRYEKVRMPRAHQAQLGAREQGQLMHDRDISRHLVEPDQPRGDVSMFNYDATRAAV